MLQWPEFPQDIVSQFRSVLDQLPLLVPPLWVPMNLKAFNWHLSFHLLFLLFSWLFLGDSVTSCFFSFGSSMGSPCVCLFSSREAFRNDHFFSSVTPLHGQPSDGPCFTLRCKHSAMIIPAFLCTHVIQSLRRNPAEAGSARSGLSSLSSYLSSLARAATNA